MPHISLNEDLPGIRALLDFSPATAGPLTGLAEILLRNDDGISRAERELIATYVSHLNDCYYCDNAHGEIVAYYHNGDRSVVKQVREDYITADISPKLKTLLNIASKVKRGGRYVTHDDIELAKEQGATDKDIHDTVLIAAAFCMYNRYVDGLATWAPGPDEAFIPIGQMLAEKGYIAVTPVEAE